MPVSAPAAAGGDAGFLDRVSRHLREHPQAQVYDDRGRLRPLTREEAERLAQVALRAARPWMAVAEVPTGVEPAA